MEIVLLTALGAVVTKLVSFTKFLSNKDWNAALTQAYVWGIGIAVIFIASQATLFNEIHIIGKHLTDGPDTATHLGDLNFFAILLLGLEGSSLFGVIYDWRKAKDLTDTALEPPLIPQLAETTGSVSTSVEIHSHTEVTPAPEPVAKRKKE